VFGTKRWIKSRELIIPDFKELNKILKASDINEIFIFK